MGGPRSKPVDAPTRDRLRPLRIYVSDVERGQIEAAAKTAGLSVSSYLRALGVGHEPASALDHEAISSLIQIAGNQGRLGGLLKLWLSERPGEGASEVDVAGLLDDLVMLTSALRTKVLSL